MDLGLKIEMYRVILYNFNYSNNFSEIIIMNNIYFYLFFGILLYFIFTRVFENFTQSQENFDPSLVPVSSIVTFAKIANRLLNSGSNTLVNPGNLQVGNDLNNPGNLTVTGNAIISGPTSLNTLTATGNSKLNSLAVNTNTVLDNTLSVQGITSSQFHTNDNRGAFYIDPRSNTGSIAWYNPNGSSLNLWSDNYGNDIISFDNTGNTNMINAKASGTLNVTDTSTLGTTTISGNIKTTGSYTSFYNSKVGLNTHLPYSDGINYIRGDLQVDGDVTSNGVITSGHISYRSTTIILGSDGTTQQAYFDSSLIPGVKYLAEAHIYIPRNGTGGDGIIGMFYNINGAAFGLPCSMGFGDQGTSKYQRDGNDDVGFTGNISIRDSAIAVITGPNIDFRIKIGTNDAWRVTIYITLKPCNLLN